MRRRASVGGDSGNEISAVRGGSIEHDRDHNRHRFHGPDLFGNGFAYGRYLYSALHAYGKALRIETRDTLIDREYTLVVNWIYFYSQRRKYTAHGVLRWQ